MKFSDIPQFTGDGKYEINVPVRSIKRWLNDQFEESGLELNPDFQRGHVWTKEQQSHYIEYLLRGGRAARTILFNHPGWMSSFKGHMVCVDGLQRLTACCDFLDNKVKVFGKYYLSDFDEKLPIDIDLRINVNELKTRKEVLQWYIELNSGGTIHTDAEIERVKELLKKEEQK